MTARALVLRRFIFIPVTISETGRMAGGRGFERSLSRNVILVAYRRGNRDRCSLILQMTGGAIPRRISMFSAAVRKISN